MAILVANYSKYIICANLLHNGMKGKGSNYIRSSISKITFYENFCHQPDNDVKMLKCYYIPCLHLKLQKLSHDEDNGIYITSPSVSFSLPFKLQLSKDIKRNFWLWNKSQNICIRILKRPNCYTLTIYFYFLG